MCDFQLSGRTKIYQHLSLRTPVKSLLSIHQSLALLYLLFSPLSFPNKSPTFLSLALYLLERRIIKEETKGKGEEIITNTRINPEGSETEKHQTHTDLHQHQEMRLLREPQMRTKTV
ncbi:hypothetical protein CRENBAI_016097 [Crenichthys baileyi]|uniref:Uncharacterized protein n=1 Tax=Crenichthys baileyi TaxID=28760 RepID=A0AAV9RDC0_9TELE